ncbi:unnamed protein product [Cylicostephanus goldi]|uniref:TOG domain-containing protein n=1 Tax=Cylicostephanus goldi TaxID=71465 RepID=A0A3P7NJ54_CYLGO|nr:unnamed protein product [Cylicostephanus goldi]
MTIYGEVMDELKKIIARDSNINVVIAALHVLKNLALGLRKCFACFIPMVCCFTIYVWQETVPIDFAKAVLPIVVKLTTDSDPTVRDAACSSLGSAQRLLGGGLDAFLGSLKGEKAKMDKIEEYREAATKEHAEFAASRPKQAMVENAAGGDVDSEGVRKIFQTLSITSA